QRRAFAFQPCDAFAQEVHAIEQRARLGDGLPFTPQQIEVDFARAGTRRFHARRAGDQIAEVERQACGVRGRRAFWAVGGRSIVFVAQLRIGQQSRRVGLGVRDA